MLLIPSKLRRIVTAALVTIELAFPLSALAQADFNPHFIISDPELEDYQSWTANDVQQFLIDRGSFLKNYNANDITGVRKTAAEIIYDASQAYHINPKFLVVTLQKEQSLITDDAPTQKQLDWATGYAVCDSCSLEDPKVIKYRGFAKQVDNAAGIMRWYYDNRDKPVVKKKDFVTMIDNLEVSPQSWATAFLYTYTPHLHGNQNFWRIWNTWFEQVYPNGTLLVSATNPNAYWLIQDGQKRQFKNKTALITRLDPKNAIKVNDLDLTNYKDGPLIAFSNYSLLHTPTQTYLLDYDTLRPFESDTVVRKLGFNPDELIDVEEADLAGYNIGTIITASSTAPQGVIYQVTDLNNSYYLLKNDTLYPITDKAILAVNYKSLPIEKHKAKDLRAFPTADLPVVFKDGTLLKEKNATEVYVLDHGKKRKISDDDTFLALGYKRANVVEANPLTLLNIPTGEPLFMNTSLLSSKNKFLGDSGAPVADLYTKNNVASYLVAEYPSGRIVSGKNIDDRRSIASLTKLLTGYEALKQGFSLKKTTVYDETKYASEGNALTFKNGDKVTNKDLFYAMTVVSNNQAARIIAQGTKLDEDEMISQINHRLEEWGADYTTIHEPTGLDGDNKSTARDLLKIFTKVLEDKTMKDALAQTTYTFQKVDAKKKIDKRILHNSNQILKNIPLAKRHYRVLATKTGFTEEANATMIMLIESKKTKKQYVVVTLGNPDYAHRFEEPHKIAEWITTTDLKLATN